MSSRRTQLKNGFTAGAKKGWRSFIWMCKIIIPISFLVALLQWTGWLNELGFLLNPLMNSINLPSEAALPIITGLLINIYAVVAIITIIPFSVEQMTLIAIFNLIAHNLIMEGVIQHKSGVNVVKIGLIRVAAAILTVLAVSQFFGDTAQSVAVPDTAMVGIPFFELLKAWAINIVGLLLKILGIIMLIMILFESLRAFGWNEYSMRLFSPLVRLLGLSSRVSMLWVAAILFGVLYGGAVIVEEAKRAALTKEEIERFHISVGVNHAMVEDPALFAVLGPNIFWLWVPRFITAIITVQTYRAIIYLKKKLLHR